MPVCTLNNPKQYLDIHEVNLLRMCVMHQDVLTSDGDVYYMFGKFVNYGYFQYAEKYFLHEMKKQEEANLFLRSRVYYYMKLCAIAVETHNN